MKLKLANTALVLVASILTGCASGYSSFYKPAEGATAEAISSIRATTPPAMPILERSAPGNPDAVVAAYAKRGYVVIGTSMFNSGHNESEEAALKQGKSVGADLVLVLNPQYTGTVTSSIPLTMPTSTTSYSSGTATAYGPNGTVNAYGNSTTTTYGSKTTYIPMSVNRSDYGAVYFVKRTFNLGAFVRDLNDTERQELQTNHGVIVLTIVDDTPAFNADVLPGDVITAIDGVSVSNQAGFQSMLGARKGKLVSFSLVRRGQPVEKSIQLNN
jgi:hypothetical protein